jgi:hypothetical protein
VWAHCLMPISFAQLWMMLTIFIPIRKGYHVAVSSDAMDMRE